MLLKTTFDMDFSFCLPGDKPFPACRCGDSGLLLKLITIFFLNVANANRNGRVHCVLLVAFIVVLIVELINLFSYSSILSTEYQILNCIQNINRKVKMDGK